MTQEAYGRGPMALPPFGRGARIVLGVLWGGYLLYVVCALWLRLPWTATLALDPVEATLGLQPWRLVTYPFVNEEPFGLIFTSLFVWFLSGDLEARWGTKPYLRFALWMFAAGAIGALLVVPIALLAPPNSLLAGFCGPSGGPHVFALGLAVAWSVVYPDRLLYLLFFLPVRGKWLVWFGLGLEALMLLLQRLTLTSFFGSLAATGLGWLLVTGKWRPSRWRRAKQKPVVRSRSGSLRVIRGGRGQVDDEPDDDDDDDGGSDDSLPPKPKYLN